MAVSAATAEKFPQSIRRDSRLLARRIGPRRLQLADMRERMHRNTSDPAEARRLDGVFAELLKAAA